MSEGVTQALARYVATAKAESLPAPVRKEAARAFVNWTGCAIGGSHHETLDLALAALAPFSGPPTASVLGRSERLDPLHAALMSCADLMLDEDVIALQRMILQETGKFSDLAGTFYKNGIRRTVAALADWLRAQQARGLIVLDDADEAAGMLIGMLSSAPQRAAIFGGVPMLSRPAIEARVRACVKLFLRGCQQA